MRNFFELVLALSALLAMIVIAVLVLGAVVCSGIGLYLAFKASLLIFFLALIIEPMPAAIGIIYCLTGTNIVQVIVEKFLS